MGRPKWSASDLIVDSEHVLIVVYHEVDQGLLFINSSVSAEGLYDAVVTAIAPQAATLSMAQVRRVVRRLRHQRVFNFGMRNIQASNSAESYRIIAGPNAQATIDPVDARLYRQGHVFMTGDVEGQKVTIGYSSGSKVWASAQERIPGLLAWCRAIGREIRVDTAIVTNSGLDYVPTGDVTATLPPNIVLAQWNREAFDIESPARVEYTGDDGRVHRSLLMDLDLSIDRQRSDASQVVLAVASEQLCYLIRFSLSVADDEFYAPVVSEERELIRVVHGAEPMSLIDYLNIAYLDLYTADGGVLVGNELSVPLAHAAPIDREQLHVWDWSGVDITREVSAGPLGMSVHDRVRARLAGEDDEVVFSDHGSGEIADFVALRREAETLTFTLYHCKGSEETFPGARVTDVYEVCGQAQKSAVWRRLDLIRRRLDPRLDQLAFVRGTAEQLSALLTQAETLRQLFRIVVVQPGISAGGITTPLLENLGATSAHLTRAGFQRLRVAVSA